GVAEEGSAYRPNRAGQNRQNERGRVPHQVSATRCKICEETPHLRTSRLMSGQNPWRRPLVPLASQLDADVSPSAERPQWAESDVARVRKPQPSSSIFGGGDCFDSRRGRYVSCRFRGGPNVCIHGRT